MPVLEASFYRDCWTHWHEMSNHGFVINDKIPVPYFGNIRSYMRAPTRVITLGLNPNREVFECTRSTVRLTPAITEQRLSRYFVERVDTGRWPGWFSNYEAILNGMGHSYLSDECGAIHVDLCSPIATNPTWSKLALQQKHLLRERGRKLFDRLYQMLEPDIIIVSVAKREVAHHWGNPFDPPWQSLPLAPLKAGGTKQGGSYDLRYRLGDGRGRTTCMVVFGTAARKPFGRLTAERQHAVGKSIIQRFDNHRRS